MKMMMKVSFTDSLLLLTYLYHPQFDKSVWLARRDNWDNSTVTLQSSSIVWFLFSFFSPVVGGASFADIGVALDEILSLSMDVSDEETKEPFPVHSHRDIVISCCWLNIKVRSWCPFVWTVFEAVACNRMFCVMTYTHFPWVVTFSRPCFLQCACQLLAVIFETNTAKLELMSMSTLLDEETLKLVAETACKVILQCRHQVLLYSILFILIFCHLFY